MWRPSHTENTGHSFPVRLSTKQGAGLLHLCSPLGCSLFLPGAPLGCPPPHLPCSCSLSTDCGLGHLPTQSHPGDFWSRCIQLLVFEVSPTSHLLHPSTSWLPGSLKHALRTPTHMHTQHTPTCLGHSSQTRVPLHGD